MQEVRAEPMTTESFAPFGRVLAPREELITLRNEQVSHYNELGNLEDMGPDPVVSFFSTTRREFVIESLERHRETCELFFPVHGIGLMPFAPSLHDGEPDIENMRVFICVPGRPFIGGRGVWHLFPFPVEDRYDAFNIVMRELIDEDLENRELGKPVRVVL
jgi:ureidoglycolate hydrolase